ncbi:MAG: hypothetical protein RIS63_1541, partial [Bacteroidota bacterium]
MKHFFQILFIGLAFVSFGQKKSFDLKESVLKQRALSPVRLNNFQWIPESDTYTFCSADWQSLQQSAVASEKSIELTSVKEINEKLGTNFGHLAFAKWVSKDVLEVSDGGSVYALYNTTTKTGSVQKVPDGAENAH